jgi:hypothetical protein
MAATEFMREMQTYQRNAAKFAGQEGKFAVILGDELLDVLASYEDALKVGYGRDPKGHFLVKKISRAEPVYFFSRDIGTIDHATDGDSNIASGADS